MWLLYGVGCGMLYQYVKKTNLGGGHSITEQPLAQQQQAQFRCTQLEDVVEYNAIPISNLYIIRSLLLTIFVSVLDHVRCSTWAQSESGDRKFSQ
jgi:hypothetical protein